MRHFVSIGLFFAVSSVAANGLASSDAKPIDQEEVKLAARHPDWAQVLTSKPFQTWLGSLVGPASGFASSCRSTNSAEVMGACLDAFKASQQGPGIGTKAKNATPAVSNSNTSHGQSTEPKRVSLADLKRRFPSLQGLSDAEAFDAVHAAFYADMDKAELARRIGFTLPPPPPGPRKLSAWERWRYESCQQDATKAPTTKGVTEGLWLCREKFGQ